MGNGLDCAGRRPEEPITMESQSAGKNTVEIAASVLFQIPVLATAYHTSVLVNDEEFFFSDSGICYDKTLMSHQGKPSERTFMGRTDYTGAELWWALDQHFRPGTYDLLRKNCNSFSDCVLYFLVRKRLDPKYSAAERLGQYTPSVLEQVTGGMYTANPNVADFDVEQVITALQKVKVPSAKEMAKARYSNQSSSSMRAGTGPLQMSLPVGTEVQIIGLKNASALNGQAAKILRYNAVSGRLEVQIISTEEVKAVRAENLRPLGQRAFAEGDHVRIDGLQSEAGQVLNGKEGVVKRYLLDSSRYEVEVGDEVKSFKTTNLQPL